MKKLLFILVLGSFASIGFSQTWVQVYISTPENLTILWGELHIGEYSSGSGGWNINSTRTIDSNYVTGSSTNEPLWHPNVAALVSPPTTTTKNFTGFLTGEIDNFRTKWQFMQIETSHVFERELTKTSFETASRNGSMRTGITYTVLNY